MSLLKNIYLSVELENSEDEDNPEIMARLLADRLLTQFKDVKSVQYRYGAFGRVDKVHSE